MTSYGVIPLHDIVAFPRMMFPLWVGREKPIAAVNHAWARTKKIVLVSQRRFGLEQPPVEDLRTIGTICDLIRMPPLEGGANALFQCAYRFQIDRFFADGSFISAEGISLPEVSAARADGEAVLAQAKARFEALDAKKFAILPDMRMVIEDLAEPGALADMLAANLLGAPNQDDDDNSARAAERDWPWQEKRQQVLEILDGWERLDHVLRILEA